MPVDVKYRAEATATGGRDGRAVTSDGSLNVKLTTPRELGGAGGEGNNPEQLFAAGYAACFIGAMKFIGGMLKTPIPAETNIKATVGIGPRSEGGFGLEVDLHVTVPGWEHEQAVALVEKAHQACPYSNATRGNIPVRLTVA
jgi:lipoyl-dependent peroxiredoxin